MGLSKERNERYKELFDILEEVRTGHKKTQQTNKQKTLPNTNKKT